MTAKKGNMIKGKKETTAMRQVEPRQVADLIPHAMNARTHSDEQVAQIAASIREFGFTNPVLIDPKNGIIAGHGRLLAARKLGMDTVPCIVLDGLSDAQRRAYILADNKLALNAGWDFPLLREALTELDTGEIDMALTGFSTEELEQMMTWTKEPTVAGKLDYNKAFGEDIKAQEGTFHLTVLVPVEHQLAFDEHIKKKGKALIVAAIIAEVKKNVGN